MRVPGIAGSPIACEIAVEVIAQRRARELGLLIQGVVGGGDSGRQRRGTLNELRDLGLVIRLIKPLSQLFERCAAFGMGDPQEARSRIIVIGGGDAVGPLQLRAAAQCIVRQGRGQRDLRELRIGIVAIGDRRLRIGTHR